MVIDAEHVHLGLYNHRPLFALLLEKLSVMHVAQIPGAHQELTVEFDGARSSQHCVFFTSMSSFNCIYLEHLPVSKVHLEKQFHAPYQFIIDIRLGQP